VKEPNRHPSGTGEEGATPLKTNLNIAVDTPPDTAEDTEG
jgi:hypothetical protein